MQITYPAFYKKFTCIADQCPDTCCAGWQIMIDDKSLRKYRRYKGSFRNRLHNDINWNEHSFYQYDHRCAFLNEKNLCDMYSEAGSHMLCDTCRKYPRHIEEFEGLREYSLSLSCPESARILLSQKEPISFLTKDIPSKEEVYDDFDYLLFTALMDTREYFLSILQDRSISIKLRCQKLLACAHDFQLSLDKNELYRWEEIRKRHQNSSYGESFQNHLKKWHTSTSLFIVKKEIWETIIPQMEVLRPNWHNFLRETLTPLFDSNLSPENFQLTYREFNTAYPDWNIQAEQLLVYWIYTYFCGAVYDDSIFAKVKMAIVCTSMIHDLAVGTYLRQNQYFHTEDLISICYRFSRELEHSDLNLNKLEELLEKKDAFKFEKLIAL